MNRRNAHRGRERSRRSRSSLAAAAVAIAFVATRANAVIQVDTAARNAAAPTGSTLAPWNLEGQFGNFLGTPIAPNLFIAAQHIGDGGAGLSFGVGGQSYTTTGSTDIAGTDLRVYQIDTLGGTHTFSAYASLYDADQSGSEVGKPLFVAGRGTQRGDPYVANGTQRGWLWGTDDNVQSWGTSTVAAIATDDTLGDFVSFEFNDPGGIGLTAGDSSGGLFVDADGHGHWELAGINFGVDSGWSTSAGGPYVDADVYDARGLYVGDATDHQYVPPDATDYAGASYASRISSNRVAIDAIFLASGNPTLVPEPATLLAIAAGIVVASRRSGRGR